MAGRILVPGASAAIPLAIVPGSKVSARWSLRPARNAAIGVAALMTASIARASPSELDPTIGYHYGEIEVPRHVGTGGAQRALSSSVGALFVNPANIASSRVYHVAAFAQIWPEARRQSYGAAASDSVVSSSHVAGAAGFTYNVQDPDGVDREWMDARFALAFPFSDQLMLGIGGRYLSLRQDGTGPLGGSLASGGLEDSQVVKEFSFDAGLTLKPIPEFAIALVGNNLTNPGHGFSPTSVGGGIGFGTRELAVQFDLVSDFTTWDQTRLLAMSGVDALLAEHLALRGGYRFDQGAESHAISGGMGYIDRAFLVDIGLRRVVSGEAATTIVLGFTYHLEATGLTPSPSDTF